MFDPRANLRLVAVFAALHLINDTRAAGALIREVARLGRFASNQFLLARVGAVALDAPLLPMQQMWQRMLVMHIGRGEHRAVHQPALAVHPDVQLRTEVPLRPFLV